MRWETLRIDSALCAEAQILSRSGQMLIITFSVIRAAKGGNREQK
jgi:hypothetical protein